MSLPTARALLDALPMAALLTDGAGTVLAANTAAGAEPPGQDARRIPCGEGHLVLPASQASRLELLGRLSAGIAHDFNNILAMMLATAEALRGHAPEAARQDLEQAALHGRALVGQLLGMVRGDLGVLRPIQVNNSLRHLATLLPRLLGPAIAISLDLEEPSASLRLDPSQWDQVLLNLAANARDAMQGQGRLHLAARREGRQVVVSVTDDGPGVPADVLPRIFEDFYTTRLDHGGTGLGLATVQGIVAAAGGSIEVTSTAGGGACFRLLLPALMEGPVLVVEDEPTLRRLADLALTQAGHAVMLVEDAESALDLLRAGKPVGLLLADISLPGMDGVTLAAAACAIRPGLPVLLVSGYGRRALGAAAPSAEIPLLTKPYTAQELRSAVAAVLGTDVPS